ncbi:energy transducer TonB [Flavobacterium sp. WC2429]|uniref:Energy transducer TonB n=2 Tax=unclassified Flavobacterium TaxID=196869 RepID=A0AB39WBH7_9FLAO
MSKQSLYEANWINLVFENRNKEYGAYQLRKENAKTSILALFMGVLLCASLISIPRVLSFFNLITTATATIIEPIDEIIQLTTVQPQVKKQEEKILPKTLTQKPLESIDKKQLTNPVIVKGPLATPDLATTVESTTIIKNTTDGTGTIGTSTTPSQGNVTVISAPVDYGDTVVTTAILDKMPEFPGGINKFYNYIGKNFESPEVNGESSIRIYVSFVVEKDGSMSNIQVKNEPGYGLGREAIRVLKSMRTKWSPGMINSKAVRTSYNLPITVQMH